MDWVKKLKITNFDGVFSKDDIRKNNCGIINLDDKSGPGTHWVCYVKDFYYDPFGLPPPENIANSFKLFNTLQYQEKDSVLCGYFCLFFIKKHQDGHPTYDILYKILDPISPSKNERIINDYFIGNGDI